jgi:LysM repeat protein
MLTGMNMADPDQAAPPSAAAPRGPAQLSIDQLAPDTVTSGTRSGARRGDLAVPTGCPFLVSEVGGWRLDIPAREHRCSAVIPPAALSLDKQQRLCLTDAHVACATYIASMSARGARLGIAPDVRTTRWGLARTTTVIEDAGGMRARVLALLLDRRRWPAIPAVILVTTLVVLAFSGLRAGGATPVATSLPTHAATAVSPSVPASTPAPASQQPAGSEPPSAAPTTEPTAVPARPTPTPAATSGPIETFRTYTVKSGDSLSEIAGKYGTTSRAIADLNGFSVNATLHIGQVLKIPNPAP